MWLPVVITIFVLASSSHPLPLSRPQRRQQIFTFEATPSTTSSRTREDTQIPDEFASWLANNNGDGDSKRLVAEPLNGPGYCNRLYRILPGVGILKVYSELTRERKRISGFSDVDSLLGDMQIGPQIMQSSPRGILMTDLDAPSLTESEIHASNATHILLAVAKSLAIMHSIPITRNTKEKTNDPKTTKNMLWSSLEILLSRMDDDSPQKEYYQEQVEFQRCQLQALKLPVVLGHGDFKPSNVILWDQKAIFLDFEMVGCHYRAYDLAKFFRTNHPTPWTKENREAFYRYYSNNAPTLPLELESKLLLPMTWLEAAMFFETIQEHSLAQDRRRHYEESCKHFQKDIEAYCRLLENSSREKREASSKIL